MGEAHYKSMDCHLEVKKKREETMILLSGPRVLGGRTKGSKETKGNFLRKAFASIVDSLLTPYWSPRNLFNLIASQPV